MKIHEIIIENIASLKGKHLINFDDIAADSSLFAITGKTGSGKSTILNCISLALYNNVYKKDSQSNDFVTLGEDQGSIELEFSSEAAKYKAIWQMRLKKKNGEYLKKPDFTRSLSVFDGNKYTAIETPTEEILNLTFDQFCKTCILNQGEFARFLTSPFKDRKDILEKFYTGFDLEKINSLINEKLKNQKADIEVHENQIKGIERSIENIDVTQGIIDELTKSYQKYETLDQYTQKIAKSLELINESLGTIQTNTKRLEQVRSQLKESQHQLNKKLLEKETLDKKYQQILTKYKERTPLLRKIIENEKLISQKEQTLTNLDKTKKHLTSDSHELKSEALVLNKKIADKNHQIEKILIEFNEMEAYKSLDAHQLLNEQVKLNEFIKSLDQKNTELSKEILSFTAEIKTSQKILNEKQTRIGQLQSLKLDQERQKLQELISKLDSIDHQLKIALKEKSNSQKEIKDKQKVLADNTEELLKLQGELKTVEQNIQLNLTSQKTLELDEAIQLCQVHSAKSGQCVVCDAVFSKDVKQPTQLNEEELKANLEANHVKKNELTEKVSSLRFKNLSYQESINKIKQKESEQLGELMKSWNSIAELPLSQNVLSDKSTLHIEQLKSKKEKKLDELESKILEFNLAKQDISQKEQQIQELQEKLKQKNESFKSNLEMHQDKLASYKNNCQQAGVNFNKDMNLTQPLFELKVTAIKSYQDLSKDLEQSSERLSIVKKNTEQNTLRLEEINQSIVNEQKLHKELVDFNAQHIEAGKPAHVELQQLEDSKARLEEHLDEIQKLINQENITQAEGKSKSEHYQEQIKDSHLFISKAKQSIENNTELQQQDYSQIKQAEQIKSLITKVLASDFADTTVYPLFENSLVQFTQYMSETKSSYNALKEDLSSKKSLFSQKLKALAEIKEMQSKRTSSQSKLIEYEELYGLIGKDEFRNYILAIIETTLIDQTNSELEKLCQGRYHLSQSNKTNRLSTEFKIIDHFADAQKRKISTLSGGETFLVSLAMALALAELTRGQTNIDSLFIDEGFGTLDKETIEEVFELLINIQNSGKQLGIISHVHELTSRIPINIALNKSTMGHSTIDIIYN